MSELTPNQCEQWLADPTTNPITGRKIKEGGATYNRFKKQCIGSDSGMRCEKKWYRVTEDEAHDYGKQYMTNCPCGSYKFAHAVHDTCGGYYCDRCDGAVDIAYLCYKCKGVTE